MWRLIYGLLGCAVGALAGLFPVGWTFAMFVGTPNWRSCSLVGSEVGAVVGLLCGAWFVSAAFVGVLGSFLGAQVGREVRYLYIQHVAPDMPPGDDLGAGYWAMYGIVAGAILGILLGLWLVAHLRELKRVRVRRP